MPTAGNSIDGTGDESSDGDGTDGEDASDVAVLRATAGDEDTSHVGATGKTEEDTSDVDNVRGRSDEESTSNVAVDSLKRTSSKSGSKLKCMFAMPSSG